jgi:hypothetical protein
MTSPSPVATRLNCTQCGGELHPGEGQVFLTCPYCGATVYLDTARVVFHWSIAPTLNDQQALAALYRWMSGAQTVKDLDKKSSVAGQAFQYFPLWYFKWSAGSEEREALEPAAATAVTELAHLRLPAGDFKPYHPSLDALAVQPSVPLEAALDWLRQQHGPQSASGLRETAVVHVPVYFFRYEYRGQLYTAVVDGATGTVLANIYPTKEETPYRVVGGVTALIFLCLATFPLFGMMFNEETGLMVGLAACGGLGLVAAPVLFAWAYWVASKV